MKMTSGRTSFSAPPCVWCSVLQFCFARNHHSSFICQFLCMQIYFVQCLALFSSFPLYFLAFIFIFQSSACFPVFSFVFYWQLYFSVFNIFFNSIQPCYLVFNFFFQCSTFFLVFSFVLKFVFQCSTSFFNVLLQLCFPMLISDHFHSFRLRFISYS